MKNTSDIPKLNPDDMCDCWGWHTDCSCGKTDFNTKLNIVAGGVEVKHTEPEIYTEYELMELKENT